LRAALKAKDGELYLLNQKNERNMATQREELMKQAQDSQDLINQKHN
jgi:hypothetical protein